MQNEMQLLKELHSYVANKRQNLIWDLGFPASRLTETQKAKLYGRIDAYGDMLEKILEQQLQLIKEQDVQN